MSKSKGLSSNTPIHTKEKTDQALNCKTQSGKKNASK